MINSLSTYTYICLEGEKKKSKAVGITEKPTTTTKPVCGICPAVAVASRCVWLTSLGSEVFLLCCGRAAEGINFPRAYACFNVMQALSSGNSGSLKAVEVSLSILAVAATMFTF